ncbi:hypothetical protein DFJ58DRAFT_847776 [Suillus subalutaceus]|uniref:uncharacterized protein n=1 Tax=Suillus subalutaceus TaxID=48586 RepID=UPI001B881A28|nr:uncharacterized protein DFJ58DRAFT_847776 [Suillus subalutaceus]KAG1833661.1 hypothetical protein DFJ58DRAFT_847776 [Suillus subalutaceus]
MGKKRVCLTVIIQWYDFTTFHGINKGRQMYVVAHRWRRSGASSEKISRNKAIARDVIKWLCRDEVIFQHMKNPGDPTKLRSVKGILQRFKEKGYLNDQVEEALLLAGESKIKRIWSSESCQKPLPGSAEERKPDIILLPNDPLVQDCVVSSRLAEMKQHGDARNFVIVLMFVGEAFTFAFFDRGGAVCLDMLSIVDDKEEYLRLVLYLSLADPGCMVGLETSIMQNKAGRFIRSRVFGPKVPINMVLFISNNIHGRGTVARHVTLSLGGFWGAMEKWLKGMEKEVDVVVKDTWVDLTAPHTEGMILNYLRLKGVQGVTRLLFEGLVAGPASPPPLFQTHDRPGIGSLKDIGTISQTGDINVWSSTVYNRSFWGVPTLALATRAWLGGRQHMTAAILCLKASQYQSWNL